MANTRVTLTRAAFQLVAETIRLLPSFETFNADGTRYACEVVNFDSVVHRFSEALASTNPRFSRSRFEAGCYGREVRKLARVA